MVKSEHDGDRLAALLDRSGKTQVELAIATDVTDQAVGKWIRTGKIARERITAICTALACSADELLGLRPIDSALAAVTPSGVRELPVDYGPVVQREQFREAAELVAEGLGRGLARRKPESIADLILAVHDLRATGAPKEQVVRIIKNAS